MIGRASHLTDEEKIQVALEEIKELEKQIQVSKVKSDMLLMVVHFQVRRIREILEGKIPTINF